MRKEDQREVVAVLVTEEGGERIGDRKGNKQAETLLGSHLHSAVVESLSRV